MHLEQLTGRADMHIHTNVSDGIAPVHQVLDHIARHTHLNVIAITDHDRLDASLWAYEHRARYPFEIVPGLEVTTREGHVLALWVTQPIPRALSLKETVAAIHAQGGIAIIAHPIEPTIDFAAARRHLFDPAGLINSEIDAIEVFNAGAFTPGCNWLAQRVYQDRGITLVGNSDAHMPSSIGSGITRFRGSTAADLRDSLANGWTAVEGKRWHITTYLKLLRTGIQWTLSASSRAKLPSTHPTPL